MFDFYKNAKQFAWNKVKHQEMFKNTNNKSLKITTFIGYLFSITAIIIEIILCLILYLLFIYLNNIAIFILYFLLFLLASIFIYIYFEGGIIVIKYSKYLKEANKKDK